MVLGDVPRGEGARCLVRASPPPHLSVFAVEVHPARVRVDPLSQFGGAPDAAALSARLILRWTIGVTVESSTAVKFRGMQHAAVAGEQVLVAVRGSGRVAVLSGQGRLVRSVPVGLRPHGIAVKAGP